MASYYHDARAHARKLKEMSEDNKRRAERKAEIAETQVEHPLNYLFLEGRSCKLFRNSEQHQNLENGVGLISWGNGGTLIDRFDGRALLDFYKEPDPSAWTRPKAVQEEKLDQSLRFESFRDLVRLASKGIAESEGLTFARQENIEIRAAMRAAATAAAAAAAGQRNPQPLGSALPAAGTGAFSAVGFNYNGSAGRVGSGGGGDSSSSSDSDDDDSDENEGGGGDDADAGQEAEDDRIDDIAEQHGLPDFSYRLHRVLQQEGEEEARLRKPPRRRVSRKSARERARRMAGMGLDPSGAPIGPARDWTQPPPRSAAADTIRIIPPRASRDMTEDGSGHRRRWSRSCSRSRSRSQSRSPRRHRREESGRTHFITEFSSAAAPQSYKGIGGGRGGRGGACVVGGVAAALAQQQQQLAANRPTIDRSMFEREEGILDALPDMPDPAAMGAQPIPLPPTSVQAMRAAAAEVGRRDSRCGGGAGGGGGGSRGERGSRSERERDERERNYHGYSYRRRHEPSHHGSRSRSRSRGRSRSRDREQERDRGSREYEWLASGGGRGGGDAGEADRFRDRQLMGSSVSAMAAGGGASKASSSAMPGVAGSSGSKLTSSSSVPGASITRETPQERLKRIMAAQLNKQAQKDHLVAAQRKFQVEKEKEARQALERVVMRRSPSPPPRDRDRDRDRDRSENDGQRRGRSRSISRSRSPRDCGSGGYRRPSRSR